MVRTGLDRINFLKKTTVAQRVLMCMRGILKMTCASDLYGTVLTISST